jgi:hypothetical protein
VKWKPVHSMGTLHEAARALLLLIPLCVGCSMHNSVIRGPDTPTSLRPRSKTDPGSDPDITNEIKNFYFGRCLEDTTPFPTAPLSTPAPNCGSRREQRDTIIYNLKRIIDSNYDAYARNFQQTADSTNFGGEVASASLTAVATLVGVTDLKDILTTASTLTQSTSVSIQKNYFQKQTEYTILAQMDGDRLTKWNEIVQFMKKDVGEYTVGAALDDLQEYRREGTAVAALTALTQQASAKANAAAITLSNTRGVPPTQPQSPQPPPALPPAAPPPAAAPLAP